MSRRGSALLAVLLQRDLRIDLAPIALPQSLHERHVRAPVGRFEGECAPEFMLSEGVEGAGNVIGPVSFFGDYTCQVILVHIGAEW